MIGQQFTSARNWLDDEPRQRRGVRVLQAVLGVVFVFRAFTEIPFAKYMYGVGGIGDAPQFHLTFGSAVGDFLNSLFQNDVSIYPVLLILAGCGLCFIVGYRTRITTIVALFTFNILSARNLEVGDGGDNVTQLVLIYMMFLTPLDETFRKGSLKVWVHNLAVTAIGLQIMILYFTAGFMKINGKEWTEGIALYNISHVETFSLPWLRDIFKSPYVVTISAYMTMIFLTWFPIAMFSKVKLLWILIGISFHSGIIGYMGLVTFGGTMIGLELFFITDKEYAFIKETAKSLVKENPVSKFLRRSREKAISSPAAASAPSEMTN